MAPDTVEKLVHAIHTSGYAQETLAWLIRANTALYESGFHNEVADAWEKMAQRMAEGDYDNAAFHMGMTLGTWSRLKNQA